MDPKVLETCLNQVKEQSPLTLCITNQVTINDCANGLLAIGASPVMSDDPSDAETLAGLAAATVLNIGTINEFKLRVSLAAGRGARAAGKPVILDPVGVGASETRRNAAGKIIVEIKPDIIRGNLSEIKALAGLTAAQKGVDSAEEGDIPAMAEVASSLAKNLGAVVAVTGPTDVLADKTGTVSTVSGGSPLLTRITGAGCMLSALTGGYAGAAPGNPAGAAAAALSHMALAGMLAAADIASPAHLGTFRVKLFDRLSMISAGDLGAFQGVAGL
ncbi:hydroxyethylthiazole kinase [Deltaproteobacteria bacterium Smac51]|nr:hydroxyethylthiazole kinase [Deltaproteobacteria bacterium Smac51]